MFKGLSKRTGGFYQRGRNDNAPTCEFCGEFIGWRHKNGNWVAMKYGTKEPHKCVKRKVVEEEILHNPMNVY